MKVVPKLKDNKMLKEAERKDKEGDYIMAEEMTKCYNYASETMPPTTRFPELNKLRQEYLNSMKYAMYYDVWSYR